MVLIMTISSVHGTIHLDAKSIHEPYAKNPDLELDYPKPIVDLKASRVRAIEAFKQI